MKHTELLPLVPEFYNDMDILYHLTVMLTRLECIDVDFPSGEDSRAVLFWKEETKETKKELKTLLDVDPKTYSKVRFFKVEEVHAPFITLMPFNVWREFVKVSRELGTGRRKSVARVFVYFYYKCGQQGIWGRAREWLIKDLNMGRVQLAECIKWLVEHGFLMRSEFHWTGPVIYTRSYIIPDIMKAEKSSCENGKT